MSGYNRKDKTFTLTAIKLEHYHRNHPHTSFSRDICPICHAQYGREYMQPVAAFLRGNGFEVLDVGDLHLTISAPSKPRKKFGMWITKESDDLYQLLAGKIEPLPGSLPKDSEALDPYRHDAPLPPLDQFAAWLHDLKAQKAHALQTFNDDALNAEIALLETIQNKFDELLRQ